MPLPHKMDKPITKISRWSRRRLLSLRNPIPISCAKITSIMAYPKEAGMVAMNCPIKGNKTGISNKGIGVLNTSTKSNTANNAHPITIAIKTDMDLIRPGPIPMVMYPKGFLSRELVENCCRKNGFELNTVVETASGSSLFGFVKENIGATIQPVPLVKSVSAPTLRLIKIEDGPITRDVGVLYRSDKFLGFAARKFIVKKRLEMGDVFFNTKVSN